MSISTHNKTGKELELRPSYWASVSGGKDSLYMLNYILHNLDRYPLNGVVHYELEIDFPFIKTVVDYMMSECNRYNIPFFRIKPRRSWFELYEEFGFPTGIVRWCNDIYKLDGQKQLKDFLRAQNGRLITYIGYCYDEEKRYEKRNRKDEIYPLVEAKIFESDILEWAKNIPQFNNYYRYNKRCGCMFCPMQSMAQTAYLLKYYPNEYETMMALAQRTELELSIRKGRPISVFSGNPKYNTAYRDKRIREVYIAKLNEMDKQYEEDINEVYQSQDS